MKYILLIILALTAQSCATAYNPWVNADLDGLNGAVNNMWQQPTQPQKVQLVDQWGRPVQYRQ